MKRTFILAHAEARRRALAYIAEAPQGYVVTVSEPTRSSDQNAAQWPILTAFSEQLQWPVNGTLVYMEPSEWKARLSLYTRGRNDRHVALLGERDRLAQQPRLADARLASQDECSALRTDAIDQRRQERHLRLAPLKRPGADGPDHDGLHRATR